MATETRDDVRTESETFRVKARGGLVVNHRYLLDNSNTFGGTHYAYPVQVSLQLKYRFRY